LLETKPDHTPASHNTGNHPWNLLQSLSIPQKGISLAEKKTGKGYDKKGCSSKHNCLSQLAQPSSAKEK
jgi:hypothetical protein